MSMRRKTHFVTWNFFFLLLCLCLFCFIVKFYYKICKHSLLLFLKIKTLKIIIYIFIIILIFFIFHHRDPPLKAKDSHICENQFHENIWSLFLGTQIVSSKFWNCFLQNWVQNREPAFSLSQTQNQNQPKNKTSLGFGSETFN